MTDLLQKFEKEQIEKLTFKKRIPAFRPGDTLKVTVKIIEGERTRFQAFEGICIARKKIQSILNSLFVKYHMVKVLRECSHYLVQLLIKLKWLGKVMLGEQNYII